MLKTGEPQRESAKFDIEKRLIPRYTFAATSEFVDNWSLRKTVGTVEEISRNGCRVETMNELQQGTALTLRISRGEETFETKAEVLYAIERRGMGLRFVDTPDDQMKILDSWLAERASVVALL